MNKEEIKKYKVALETEQATLEQELQTIGRINPKNPEDWEAVPEKMDVLPADENEVADSIEAFEENTAILKQLEIRLKEVEAATKRIADGTYGTCLSGNDHKIESDRLEANPAATTCKKHM